MLNPELVTTRAMVLGALAHEMIHQYQHQHRLPLDHGAVFQGWKALAVNLGLHT